MRGKNFVVIANALIYGAVILGCAFALKGSGTFDQIMPVLGGGAFLIIIVSARGYGEQEKEKKTESDSRE